MKLRPFLLAASLAANAVLLGAFAFQPARLPAPVHDYFAGDDDARTTHRAAEDQARSATPATPAAASRAPLWAALATDDLRSLIARLRAAGFPTAVIREIISRQVSRLYAARLRAVENPDATLPFWKLAGYSYYPGNKQLEEINQLYRERQKLIRELLRDHALADADVTAAQRRSFGDLAPAKIDQAQRIEDDYAEMMSALRAATNGITLPEDREKFALLAREKAADLAALLTPAELSDYELRTSSSTRFLLNRLTAFDASEAEFRAVYAAQQAVNARFANGPADLQVRDNQKRDAATAAYNAQLLVGLGAARYAEFVRATDSSFQQLSRIAQQHNIPTTTAQLAYDLRDSAARESNRILDTPGLGDAQKQAALQALAQSTRGQISALLGSTAGASFTQISLPWLNALDRGSAFTVPGAPLTIIADQTTMSFGSSLRYRTVSTPAPPIR